MQVFFQSKVWCFVSAHPEQCEQLPRTMLTAKKSGLLISRIQNLPSLCTLKKKILFVAQKKFLMLGSPSPLKHWTGKFSFMRVLVVCSFVGMPLVTAEGNIITNINFFPPPDISIFIIHNSINYYSFCLIKACSFFLPFFFPPCLPAFLPPSSFLPSFLPWQKVVD